MASPLNSQKTPTLVLIAPFFLWGTAMVAMKGVIDTTTPLFLATLRLVPAGVLVLMVAALLGRKQPQSWQGWAWIGGFALVDGTLFQGFLAEGLQRTGAGLGSVMIDSQPIAVALMARFLFREVVGPLGWLGLVLGIMGISLLGLPDEWIIQTTSGLGTALSTGHWPAQTNIFAGLASVDDLLAELLGHGEWLMLLAALSMAVGTVMIAYVAHHVDPVVATGWHMIFGGLPLLGLSAYTEVQQWQGITTTGWLAIFYSTVFGSALAYGVFFYLASKGNLTSLSALTFLTPVFALTFSTSLLAENLTMVQWIGVGFTLVSIYLVNQRDVITKAVIQTLAGPSVMRVAESISPDLSKALMTWVRSQHPIDPASKP
ncbi:DMT family transporter [Leptolyngbya cf. ectocarpi LEGE 11479]|uniref:DMT family transporter n=1 Tax=Leptolyngbya cf. ectocarpi LEGE 11479 TaxID=1828722 RepID=A0A928ZX66_LEPEC|nr:DMT family transporter [Leptolyngbya ectocarpi]MBE9069048.1 DMT family transporter [Leptolyngbya cf. ectocarpi LEGE 11479]